MRYCFLGDLMEFNQSFKHTQTAHHLILSPELKAIIDNETNIYFLYKDLTKKPQNTQIFNAPVAYKYTHSNTSSPNALFLCLYIDRLKKTFLYSFDETQKTYIQTAELAYNIGVTEVSKFSYNSEILAVGGADGTLCFYETKGGKLIQTFPKQNEYIVCISFSKNAKFLAYSTFKKRLVIFDIAQGAAIKITSADEVICAIEFLHKTNFLIYGTRDNQLFLYDVLNARVIKELGSAINWPMDIFVDKEDQYALISDKAGYVHLVDLTKQEPILEPFFNTEKIVVQIKMLEDEFIYFLFEDGTVGIINIKEQIEDIVKTLEDLDIKAVYEKIAQNPILRFNATEILDQNDELYSRQLDLAMRDVIEGKKEKARTTMGKAIESPLNKQKFEGILRHSDKIVNFWQMVSKGDYVKAYDLAATSEFYRKLPFYEKLEKRFSIGLKKALSIMLKTQNEQEAQKELALFLKVPPKARIIRAMLKEPELFAKANKLFENGDFNTLITLLEKHKSLRASPIVGELEKIVKENIDEFHRLMTRGDYTASIKQMHYMKDNFENYTKELKEEFEKLSLVEKFNKSVKEKDFSLAMDLAAKHTFLVSASEYQTLDNLVFSRISLATKYALSKQFVPMDKLLRPFLKSKYSRSRAASIYKIYYLEQIDSLASKMKEQHWQNALKSYVLRFGIDSAVDGLCKKYDKDKILNQMLDLEVGGFLAYKAVTNIVTGAIVETSYKQEALQKAKQAQEEKEKIQTDKIQNDEEPQKEQTQKPKET